MKRVRMMRPAGVLWDSAQIDPYMAMLTIAIGVSTELAMKIRNIAKGDLSAADYAKIAAKYDALVDETAKNAGV